MSDEITHSDIWIRITNRMGGSTVEHHRVWDRKMFVEIRRNLERENGCTATEITEQQFNEERHA